MGDIENILMSISPIFPQARSQGDQGQGRQRPGPEPGPSPVPENASVFSDAVAENRAYFAHRALWLLGVKGSVG